MKNEPKAVEELVKKMYERFPFPSMGEKINSLNELKSIGVVNNAFKYSLGEKMDWLSGKNILDVGCGTGEYTCCLASWNANVLGVDLSESSLKLARKLAKKFNLKNVKFVKKSIFDLNSIEKKFDLVTAFGVLHHTSNARHAFEKLVEKVRRNGYVLVSVYTLTGRFQHRLKINLVKLLAGSKLEDRARLAKKLFKGKGLGQSWWVDQFANVHETYYTIGEILSWFKENDIDVVGVNPPIQLNKYRKLRFLPSFGKGKFEYWLVQFMWLWMHSCDLIVVSGKKK